MRVAMCAAAIVFAASLEAADDKAVVKEIPTKDLKINFKSGIGNSTVDKPTVITSADELTKIKALEGTAADTLKKQVDFDKEKVVFFFWGSFDTQVITPDADKPGSFTYTTRISKGGGFKTGAKLFVVPKDAEVKVTKAKKE